MGIILNFKMIQKSKLLLLVALICSKVACLTLEYILIEEDNKNCEYYDYQYITLKGDCEDAAHDLYLADITADSLSASNEPSGCYSNTDTDTLYFNSYSYSIEGSNADDSGNMQIW